MPRPKIRRKVRFEPNVTYFKPVGVRMIELEETIVTMEEFEAIRLKDFEGLNQEESAKKMGISQPTFNRLLSSARKKIASAIVDGKAIKIEGGNFVMARRFRRRGRMRGFALGPAGKCVCPKCNYSIAHKTGVPCYSLKCPKCGSPMIRR